MKTQTGDHILSLNHVTFNNTLLEKIKSRHREASSTHLSAMARVWMHKTHSRRVESWGCDATYYSQPSCPHMKIHSSTP
jgi:hypothetical protein